MTTLPAPTLFRKKLVVIEAVQIEKRMDQTSPAWWAEAIQKNQVILHGMGKWSRDLPIVEIETLEGTMTGVQGDWIIRGVKGELYPCKPDIFAATYEPATTQDDTLARTGNTAKEQEMYAAGIDVGRAIERENAAVAGGAQDDAKVYHFEQRSRFGPWIEVEKPTERSVEFVRRVAAPAAGDALPTIKGAAITGGYVVVTPSGWGEDKPQKVRDAILRLLPVNPAYTPPPSAAQQGKGGEA